MSRGYNARITGKKGTLELNGSAVIKMLYSKEVAGACNQVASKIADRAGDGYEIVEMNGFDRKSAIIKPNTIHSYYDNLQHNTLLKAVGK